jgi:hypothetical protein
MTTDDAGSPAARFKSLANSNTLVFRSALLLTGVLAQTPRRINFPNVRAAEVVEYFQHHNPKRRRGLAPLPPHSKELMFDVWLDLQPRAIDAKPVQFTKRAE